MACNCDHMEPTSTEKYYSKIACLLDELRTGNKKINKSHWNGMHPDVYSQTYDKYQFVRDGMEEELVQKLFCYSPKMMQACSLELQMWWRDYQAKNKKITAKEFEKNRINNLKIKALSKLTAEEKEALGLK